MPDKHVGKHDEAASIEQVDLPALQADDALLDAVARAGRDQSPEQLFGLDADAAQQRLGAGLLAWRREIDSEPIGELVSVEQASAALAAGRPGRRARLSMVALAAAAFLVIGCSGLALGARSAVPGSPLWGVSKVLYSERAESVQAAATAAKKLEDARRALASGNIDEAHRLLAEASNMLAAVRPQEGRDNLTAQYAMLTNELQGSPPPGQADGPPPPAESPPAGSPPPAGPPPSAEVPAGPPAPAEPSAGSPPPAEPSAVPPPPAESPHAPQLQGSTAPPANP